MDRPWTKAWRAAWRDEAMMGLSAAAKLLRWCLRDHVVEVDEDGTGWAQTEKGKPLDTEYLGVVCSLSEAEVLEGLGQLERKDFIVRQGNACGVLGWKETQESPAAARMRRHRAAPGVTDGVTVQSPTPPRGAEEQRTEDRITNDVARDKTPSPSVQTPQDHPGPRIKLTRERLCLRPDVAATRAGIPRGTLNKIEQGDLLPTRDELAHLAQAFGDPELANLPSVDDDNGATLVEQVVREHHLANVELGLAQGDPPPITAAEVRFVWEPAAGDRAAGRDPLTTWLTVIRRATEEIRRERARGNKGRSAEFFRLDATGGLGGEGRRVKYLAAADLDRREDLTPQARGSPKRRGPAPPQNDDQFGPEIRHE